MLNKKIKLILILLLIFSYPRNVFADDDNSDKEIQEIFDELDKLELDSNNKNDINKYFYEAIENNNIEDVKKFIKEGVNLNQVKNMDFETKNMTPLMFSSSKGKDFIEISKLLIANGAKYDLFILSKIGDLEKIKELVEKGDNINIETIERDNHFRTPLIFAIIYGHEEIARFFINKGAKINYENTSEGSALILSSANNYKELSELLINKGANINAKTMYGDTALMFASSSVNYEIVELLLKNGADVNSKNNEGYTALINASYMNRKEIVRLLLENGADVNIKNNKGDTALINASSENHIEIIELLLKNRADIKIKNNEGYTALDFLLNYDQFKEL